MENNLQHKYFWNILHISSLSRVHKTLRLAFEVAFPGVNVGSFTLYSESEEYYTAESRSVV